MDLRTSSKIHATPFLRYGILFGSSPFEYNFKLNKYQIHTKSLNKMMWYIGFALKSIYLLNILLQMIKTIISSDENEPSIILVDIIYLCLYGSSVILSIFIIFRGEMLIILVNRLAIIEQDLPKLLPPHKHPELKYFQYFAKSLFPASFFIGAFMSLTFLVHPYDSRYWINAFNAGKTAEQNSKKRRWISTLLWGVFEGYAGTSCTMFIFFLFEIVVITIYYICLWFQRLADDGLAAQGSEKEFKKVIIIYRMGQLVIGYTNDVIKEIIPFALSIIGFGLCITLFASIKFCKIVYFPYYFAIPAFSLVLIVISITFVPVLGHFNRISLDFIANWGLIIPNLYFEKVMKSLRPYGIVFGVFFIIEKSTGISYFLMVIDQTINLFLTYKRYEFKVTASKLLEYKN